MMLARRVYYHEHYHERGAVYCRHARRVRGAGGIERRRCRLAGRWVAAYIDGWLLPSGATMAAAAG